MKHSEKLAALRAELARDHLAGFIVPMADEYLNEYVGPSARRVEWLTGFTGSNGIVIVLADKASFFTDSRYTFQAAEQVDAALFETLDMLKTAPSEWLAENLKKSDRFGYDPRLHPPAGVERMTKAAGKAGAEMVALDRNPLDTLWTDRPEPPLAPVVPHALEFAGQSSAEKRAAIAETLRAQNRAALVVSDSASVAWLFNIRGGDLPHTPVPFSFALLQADATADLFIDPRKVTPELPAHLGHDVRIHPMAQFAAALAKLGVQRHEVQIDPGLCNAWIAQQLEQAGAKLAHAEDPCSLPRACKNIIERQGMRAAHRRDGVALVSFLAWLEAQKPGSVTELQAEAKLEDYRAAGRLHRGPSFDTIAASGPHSANAHYRATAATDRAMQDGDLLLLDSGGQYLDGTTDVTRTVAIGSPAAEMRERHTMVAKGNIALAALRFPAGTGGGEMEGLARQFLWAAGLDFGYSTGHGVGCYLGVHEGPHGISRGGRGAVKLRPGMVVSNEPGYHKAGKYGMRFENLMMVTEPEIPPGGDVPVMGFEILTLAPIDRALLVKDMLTPVEIAWIDAYHARVRAEVEGQVDAATQAWLKAATAPL